MIARSTVRLVLAAGVILASIHPGLEAVRGQQGDRRTREAQREQQQRVADIFKAMNVQPGATVADVGAGSGFFTVRLANAVGESGRVLAVDISASVLRSLRTRVAEEGLKNVDIIEGDVADPHLPDGSLDAALIVNAYHEMTQHQSMLTRIRQALKPAGRLVIVEPISPSRRDATRETQTRNHEISPDFVQKDARAAGFSIAGFEDPFSNQHGHGSEYMLVLTPASAAPALPADHVHEDVPVDALASASLRISPEEFAGLYTSAQVIVLDVRDADSYEAGRIPGARLAPMSALRGMLSELQKSTLPIVTYCSCPAEESSGRAALYLRKNGVSNVRALKGGFEGWVAAGQRVDRGKQ
jgi:rhodanese-related sulfurtransferase/predicted methyltransferase